MKLGILTFHRAYNCGAMLQAWALQTILERMGHNVSFPACNSVGYYEVKHRIQQIPPNRHGILWVVSFLKRLYLDVRHFSEYPWHFIAYNRFRRRFLREEVIQPEEFYQKYDCMIVGSDQVWNDFLSKEFAPLFWGENIDSSLPYIAYGASYGDLPLTGEKLSRVLKALNRYSAISMREQFAKNQVEKAYSKAVEVVLDPTLLLTMDDYQRIASRPVIKDKYLYCYSLYATRNLVALVKEAGRKLGLRPIITPLYIDETTVEDEIVDYNVSPKKMIGYIRNSACVIASSFHGTALSIIHNKPYVAFREQIDDNESRSASLLRQLGESERLVTPFTPLDKILLMLKTTPSIDVTQRLDSLRKKSLDWLGGALQSISMTK